MPTPTALPSAFLAGDVLTAANMNLLRGGFRVLQLFVSVMDTQQISTSATHVNITGGSVTITPQAASNKILIISTNAFLASNSSANAEIRFLRDATAIYTEVAAILATNTGGNYTSIHQDSPNSTSAITYQVQFARQLGAGDLISSVALTAGAVIVAEVSA